MSSFINRARHLPQSPTHTHRGSQVPSVRTPTPTNSGSSRSAASFNPRFPSSFTPSARNTAAATMSAARFFILLLTVAAPACVAAAGAGGACAAEKFSSNRAFAACTDLPRLGASVHWTYDAATSSLSVAFVAVPPSPGGWVAWGLNPTKDGMDGAQALVAAPKDGGAYGVETYSISGYSLGSPGRIAYDTSGLAAELGGDGRVRMFGTLKFQNGTGEVNQVWQVGPVSSGSIAPHAMATDNKAAKGKLNLVTGASTAGSAGGSLLHKKNTHGVLNAVSWGLLLPMGAIFARYLKTFQSADPAWFYLHVSCQVIGYAVGVSGWATGIHLGNLSKGITYSAHRNIGISVFALGTLQLFALFLRPKKDHKYRFYWNAYHHSMGYTIIILGIINIFKGMSILDVAQKWKTAYIIAICVLGAIALVLEAVTWGVVLKRRKSESKTYNGTSNGGLPLSM